MSKVLDTEQREQAGSDSYNRFEYQTHYIVWHIIDQIGEESEGIVICEYHDDMSQTFDGGKTFEFYQIKTKEEKEDWSLAELSKKEKKRDGSPKKSFLGYIFMNFLLFGEECNNCYFISNNSYDIDVLKWQACIEDDKILKDENTTLYDKIKTRVQNEYINGNIVNFDAVFDSFIQHTFISTAEMQLENHENYLNGHYFNMISDMSIPSNSANILLKQIISEVRKKSTEKIKPPFSFKKLVDKKGINVIEISNKLNKKFALQGSFAEFKKSLQEHSLSSKDIERIFEAKLEHERRFSDITDTRYSSIVSICRDLLGSHVKTGIDIGALKQEYRNILESQGLLSVDFDDSLLEVLWYGFQSTQAQPTGYQLTIRSLRS